MTTDTERGLQAALDDDPGNGGLRMILADFLDEQGDPRGPGYRALAARQFAPCHLKPTSSPEHDHWMFQMLAWTGPSGGFCNADGTRYTFDVNDPAEHAWFRAAEERLFGSHHRSRAAAEDCFAAAFAGLPDAVQAAILSGSGVPR